MRAFALAPCNGPPRKPSPSSSPAPAARAPASLPKPQITTNLLSVLSSNARLPLTPSVLADFFTLTSAHSGLLTVTVTSAAALEPAVLARIEKALKASEQAKGKTLKVENKVNEGILGGLVVDFGDKTVDLSAASRVSKLNALLTGAPSLPLLLPALLGSRVEPLPDPSPSLSLLSAATA